MAVADSNGAQPTGRLAEYVTVTFLALFFPARASLHISMPPNVDRDREERRAGVLSGLRPMPCVGSLVPNSVPLSRRNGLCSSGSRAERVDTLWTRRTRGAELIAAPKLLTERASSRLGMQPPRRETAKQLRLKPRVFGAPPPSASPLLPLGNVPGMMPSSATRRPRGAAQSGSSTCRTVSAAAPGEFSCPGRRSRSRRDYSAARNQRKGGPDG